MFGSKLKTWMENRIGRSKKKTQQEKEKSSQNGGRRVILESSESLAQSDTGISSGSQQILSSSTTDNKEGGYYTTTMESENSGMTHCLTAISLPSPESAYSTGYSTDGASPGGTGPPEYYINIRTGKHYFPSPAPTPTSPQPNATFSQLHSENKCIATSFLTNETSFSTVSSHPPHYSASSLNKNESYRRSRHPSVVSQVSGSSSGFSPVLRTFVPEPTRKTTLSEAVDAKPNTLSTSVPSNFEVLSYSKSSNVKSPSKSQLSSFKLFLKSPKQDKNKEKGDINKTPTFENKKKVFSPMKNNKKWYKQPFQKFGQKRVDNCESNLKNDVKKDVLFDKNIYYLTKENAASPRQRNRIKTNPWLPTEPMSSQNFHNLQINISPSLTRNRSCTNTPLQNRKTNEIENVQNRLKEMNVRYEESKEYLANLEKVVSRHVGQKLCLELSDHSEEDLTLNEMMGTYNESYVYEKETDILSDSDPTDCEDYVSDSEADNGGDEQDSHDDELDFIDNGSVTESDDNFAGNTGKCTYHDIYIKKNYFLYKSDRHYPRKDSDAKKSFRKDKDAKVRRSKDEKKRKVIKKSFKSTGGGDDDESKRRNEGKVRGKAELNENVGGLNLSRVLMERMMTRNVSKSADGTPVSIRRQNLIKELRETYIGSESSNTVPGKRKENLNGEVFIVDIEGDKKYDELITEAENIFQSMQNSPIIQNRKKLNYDDDRRYDASKTFDSIDIWRKAEKMCGPDYIFTEQEAGVRKSPKNLGLKLSVDDTPKKLRQFEFGKEKKSSFKAKSSAHSPLDPLGPTFRNFSVFKSMNIDDEKISLNSSEDFESAKKINEPKLGESPQTSSKIPGSPVVPIAFQSIDLGQPLTSYCPQSEPVKRKIYTCNKTYDKLVKRFDNTPKIFEEASQSRVRHGSMMAKKRLEGSEFKFGKMTKNDRESYSLKERKKKKIVQNGDYYCDNIGTESIGINPKRVFKPPPPPPSTSSHRHSFDTDVFR